LWKIFLAKMVQESRKGEKEKTSFSCKVKHILVI
jgi:hypothetical protein